MSGYKSQYHYLTLRVISEFNEWRVMLQGPNGVILGTRQFSEAKAKEHAVDVAKHYIHDYKHDILPVLASTEWTPTTEEDWMIWSEGEWLCGLFIS
jgi:hypothetical protein